MPSLPVIQSLDLSMHSIILCRKIQLCRKGEKIQVRRKSKEYKANIPWIRERLSRGTLQEDFYDYLIIVLFYGFCFSSSSLEYVCSLSVLFSFEINKKSLNVLPFLFKSVGQEANACSWLSVLTFKDKNPFHSLWPSFLFTRSVVRMQGQSQSKWESTSQRLETVKGREKERLPWSLLFPRRS